MEISKTQWTLRLTVINLISYMSNEQWVMKRTRYEDTIDVHNGIYIYIICESVPDLTFVPSCASHLMLTTIRCGEDHIWSYLKLINSIVYIMRYTTSVTALTWEWVGLSWEPTPYLKPIYAGIIYGATPTHHRKSHNTWQFQSWNLLILG